MTGDWRARAACKGRPTQLWFPVSAPPTRDVLEVCRTCPVNAACRAEATSTPWLAGVWGGTTQRERAASRRKKVA